MIGTEGGKLNKLFFLILCAGAIGCQTHEQRAKRIYQSEFVYKSGDDRSQLPDFSKTDIVAKNLGVASEKVENMPENLQAIVDLANHYLLSKRYYDAEETARKALKVDFRSQRAKLIVAEAAYRQKKFPASQKILESLGGLKSKDPDVLNIYALIEYETKGKVSDAMAILLRATKMDRKHIATRMNLGIISLKVRDFKTAEQRFREVIDVMPENTDAMLHLGVVAASMKNYAEASVWYRKVETVSGRSELVDFNKAVLEYRKSNKDEALAGLKEFVETYDGSIAVPKALALIEDIRFQKATKVTESTQELIGMESDRSKRRGSSIKGAH